MSVGQRRPIVFMLHALGGSARSFDGVVRLLPSFECIAIDLPGFGTAADASALGVEQVVDQVAERIRSLSPERWMLVGHSMGGKIATIIAAQAARGEIGLAAPSAVVLLAASPPEPEPMDEERRQMMIGWASEGPVSPEHARKFVTMNQAGGLTPALEASAIEDVTRASRHAWLAWLERGSLEDWSGIVGVLDTPALIVAGAEDGDDLGAEAQRRLNAPHYADARVEVVKDSGHLLPLENPELIAKLIEVHWQMAIGRQPPIPARYADLIASDRTSERTRRVLLARAKATQAEPAILSGTQVAVLKALLSHVLPQDGQGIDLAARVDAMLAHGEGDGWRFAELPADAEAYRRGLDTLDTLSDGGFAGMPGNRQIALIDLIADGRGGAEGKDLLSDRQMKLWFEDVRADAVRTWLSHPASLARIGYDGFANGGDGVRKQGFQRTHADDAEGWEPGPTATPA